jgi:isocitrate dehydrogenase (NAD+)
MTYDVTLIPGDGIGPEITAQTVRVLEASGLRFTWDEELAGVAAVEATGTPLPDATVESIRKNALALKGPLTHAMRNAVDQFGQTVVMVTHDAEAAAIAERVLILRDGRVCHDAPSGSRDQVHELMRTTGIEATARRP